MNKISIIILSLWLGLTIYTTIVVEIDRRTDHAEIVRIMAKYDAKIEGVQTGIDSLKVASDIILPNFKEIE